MTDNLIKQDSQKNIMKNQESRKIVYLDTGGLWSLEAMLHPKRFKEPRWREYLANLFDFICDPTREIRCIVPSAERENAPLPAFYKQFLEHGLMTKAEHLNASSLETSIEELHAQFREFRRHVKTNPDMLASWFKLHNHPDIRNGWLIGVPDQSKKWPGVTRWLDEFLSEYYIKDLGRIEQTLGWSDWQTAVTFSFVQRAYPYKLQAAIRKSEYWTHPTRWQVIRNPEPKQPDTAFGLALGGIIVGSIENHVFTLDAAKITKALKSIRKKIGKYWDQWPQVRTPEDARDLILPLLPGTVGGLPSKGFDKFFRATASAVVDITRILAGHPTDPTSNFLWLASKLLIQTVPFKMTPIERWLFRRWVDYPGLLNLRYKTCPHDGGFLHGNECSTCILRKQEEGE